MNMRKRMLEQTASLPSASAITVVDTPQEEDSRPKTAPGMMAALSQARLRIQELEALGAQSTIPVAKVRANPWQPRIQFDEPKLKELALSIAEIGLLQPVLVRRVAGDSADDVFYELVAGERRWRAHQLNEATDIKALIVDVSDAEMAVLALAENISRDDLSDYEIAKGMLRAEKEFPSRKRMAEAMGLSRGTLHRYLSFENLPQFIRLDLDSRPRLFGGNAASDTVAVLKKFAADAERAEKVARELWAQLLVGSLEQTKFSVTLESVLSNNGSGSASAPVVTSQRDSRKLYVGKAQAGSITKDAQTLVVKLKAGVVTEAQEARIRDLITELFSETPQQ